MTAPRLAFLGWDGAVLPRAAAWIVGNMGPDLADVVVALPGARAARRLEQHLARELPRGAVPPRLVGFGHLPDELLLPDRPVAGRLLRTLLWRDALQALPAPRRADLLRRPPAPDGAGAWLALAEEIRALHGELMRDGQDFAGVAPTARQLGGEDEGRRWDALADVRAAFLQRLQRLGLQDPHEGRRAALEAGRIDPARRVVLLGVVELNALVRGLLARLGGRATVLVVAPQERAGAFDELGAVRPEAWAACDIELPEGAWTLADRPADQAAAAAAWIAVHAAGRRADQVIVGVPDTEVVPHLQQRLLERGVVARDARGTPLARTSPVRLLEAVASHLQAQSFGSLAALLRHPDLPDALRRAGAALPDDLLARLDAYHAQHLPDALPDPWPGKPADADRRAVAAAHAAVATLLHDLSGPARPAREWAAPLAALLDAVWGPLELDDARADERLLAAALVALGEALRELAAVPEQEASPLAAVDVLRLLLRGLATAQLPPAADPDAIELLGWLELPLDDAPLLVVTGFNEGRVPEPVRGFALLPDGLRRALGLPDDARRLARDACALTLLARGQRELLLVSGRRAAAGDPLRPSRLLFLAGEDVAIARAERFARSAEPVPPAAASPHAPPARRLPRLQDAPAVTSVSVTGFGQYMRSPYRFYLERVLRLRRARDDARELDPPAFGDVAHAALEVLGQRREGPPPDADAVAAQLAARVDALIAERCGSRPTAAVALQAENLKYRLRTFAAWHARRLSEGWLVARTEWQPEGGVPLEVDGGTLRITGRIDRIDVHPASGAWRIVDYKTGDKGDDPLHTHGGHGKPWKNLQLPLYRQLVAPLRPELLALGARNEQPELGFIVLPHAAPPEPAFWRPAVWTPAELDAALAEARRVGGCILRGEFDELADFDEQDEVFAAIAGLGLLATVEDEDEDDDEDAS